MKRHSLFAHLHDVRVWWNEYVGLLDDDVVWFTAYERWLNDRPLLSDEDAETVLCGASPSWHEEDPRIIRCSYPKDHKGRHYAGGLSWPREDSE